MSGGLANMAPAAIARPFGAFSGVAVVAAGEAVAFDGVSACAIVVAVAVAASVAAAAAGAAVAAGAVVAAAVAVAALAAFAEVTEVIPRLAGPGTPSNPSNAKGSGELH